MDRRKAFRDFQCLYPGKINTVGLELSVYVSGLTVLGNFSVNLWIRDEGTLHEEKENSHRAVIVCMDMPTIHSSTMNNMEMYSQ